MGQDAKATWKRFGALVRRLREEQGIGVRELSRRAKTKTAGRGLSSPYLSRIELGRTAPPRLPVLQVLAEVLEVPVRKLELVAQGWGVLDAAETLEPFPEYKDVLQQLKEGRATFDAVLPSVLKAVKRRQDKEEHRVEIRVHRGSITILFAHRPSKG